MPPLARPPSLSLSHIHTRGARPLSLVQVRATTDAATALSDVQYIVHAIPVQSSRSYLTRMKDLISPSTPIFSLSKGLEVRSPMTARWTARRTAERRAALFAP